jgi:hypothetical protein
MELNLLQVYSSENLDILFVNLMGYGSVNYKKPVFRWLKTKKLA